MKEMYKGKVNSPATQLAEAIDLQVKNIKVKDASVLPEGPNLAVIGTDGNAETIKYESINNNILVGCTRGFQGEIRVWEKDTPIARNFTEYDLNILQENILELNKKELRDFQDDENHRTVADTEKVTWNNKVDSVEGQGLISDDEKEKLKNIESGANKYVHPVNHSANMITENSSKRFVSDEEKEKWNNPPVVDLSEYAKTVDVPELGNIAFYGVENKLIGNLYNRRIDRNTGSLIPVISGVKDDKLRKLLDAGKVVYVHYTGEQLAEMATSDGRVGELLKGRSVIGEMTLSDFQFFDSVNDVKNNDIKDNCKNVSFVTLNSYNKQIQKEFGEKVNKVNGKQLSTNDFTNDYKSTVDTLKDTAISITPRSSEDLNILTKAGFYSCRGGRNFPPGAGSYGTLIVSKADTTTDNSQTDTVQLYVDQYNNVYIRNSIDKTNAWTSWTQLGGHATKILTESEYNGLSTKDADTLYFIK